jgi:RNA polymerase sigma-70 factor (ECF subfamily)
MAESVTPLSLLERARGRDAEAWRRLVELYRPLVLYWCGRARVHGADAEDVAQEVFAAAAAGLADFRHDRPGDTFRGWLRGITRNMVLLHFRKKSRQPAAEGGPEALERLREVADPLAGADDEAEAFDGLYRRALEQVRGEFTPPIWQAFWLTVVEGRTPAALGEELEMTPAAVRQAKYRVLRRLKQEMGELLE